MRRTRFSLLGIVTLLLAAPALPQDAPEASPPADAGFGEVSQVTVVEVPVQVVYQGRPVRGLSADDFRIFDEGVPRTVESFEVVDLAIGTAPATGPATGAISGAAPAGSAGARQGLDPAGRRHFLLLFDLAFSRPHDLSRAEQAARELVATGLDPSDLVAVAFYSPRRGASMILNFTTDRGEVARVLDGLRTLLDGDDSGDAPAFAGTGERADPLGLTAGSLDVVLADLGADTGIELSLAEEALANGWAGPMGGRGGYEANKLSNMMWSAEQQIFDRRAGRVSNLSRSLASLARETAGIQGSKHLVMLSGGFDATLLDSYLEAGSRVGSHAWWASGGGDWIRQEVEAMIEELKRAGWMVHAVELQGIGAARSHREGLSLVARETGGALYDNSNDLGRALGQVIEATTVTYVLSFTADAGDSPGWEDGFRELTIEVEGLPRSARVSHRAGYRTPRGFDALTAAERRSELHGLLFAGRDQDGIGTAFRAAALPDGDGGWQVPVVIDLSGPGLLTGAPEGEVGAEILGYAFGEDGTVADFFSQRIDFADGEARAALAEGGVRFLADLDLPSDGRYRVRVIARSLRSGAASVHTVPFDLAGDGAWAPAVQQTLLAEAEGRQPWILARER